MNRAFWNRTHYNHKTQQVFSYSEGSLEDDKFQQLVQGDGLARVKSLYQRAVAFHDEKIVVEVVVACDQNEAAINRAGELTFKKALELVDDGYALLVERADAQQGQRG